MYVETNVNAECHRAFQMGSSAHLVIARLKCQLPMFCAGRPLDRQSVMDAAQLRDLLPHDSDLLIANVEIAPDRMIVNVAVVAPAAACPDCSFASDHIHGRYAHQIRDLPCCGRVLTLVVAARKFRCSNPACRRSIFCDACRSWLSRVPEPAGR